MKINCQGRGPKNPENLRTFMFKLKFEVEFSATEDPKLITTL